jgi:3-deoxy-D-manno-octulosonic-acid transferase
VRFLYICIAYLISPFWIGVLALRGFRDRNHWRGFSQRFGLGAKVAGRSIWVHAVSVGDVQAAVPLIEALLKRFSSIPLVLTTVPTRPAPARG